LQKSVSDSSDVGVGGVASPGANEDVAPPEAAFGMLHYSVANPLEGMNLEGHLSEGEGGAVALGGGEGSIEKEVPINNDKIGFGNLPKVDFGNVPIVRQSTTELKMKGGIQGKDDKVHIIVTPVEQEALTKLQDRLDLVETLVDGINVSFDGLNTCSAQIKQEIAKKIEAVVNTLKEQEKSTSNEAKKLQNNKSMVLKTQLKCLSDHQSAINLVKQHYEELIADANKDVHERRVQIVTMCNNVLNDKNVSLSMVTAPDVKFGFQLDSAKQFCRKMKIDDCDQPTPPTQVKVEAITSESVKLLWKMLELAETKPVLEYSIEIALLPDVEKIQENDELFGQKDKKKKKDKSQKKKKSKKNKSSDEESDSDSQSEEESSEESESDSGSDSSGSKEKKRKKRKNKDSKKKEKYSTKRRR